MRSVCFGSSIRFVALGCAWLGVQSAGATDLFLLRIQKEPVTRLELRVGGQVALRSPAEGLWSVATAWKEGWPYEWRHAHPDRVEESGAWTLLEGGLNLPGGRLALRDACRVEGDRVRIVRRFEWRGEQSLEHCTLSLRWILPGTTDARPLLPGISYSGNPSGARQPERVPVQTGAAGELSLYEEHRYPMPFASLEWTGEGQVLGAALHTLPSRVSGAGQRDQWWSLGLKTGLDHTELLSLSGPCASNGRRGVVKALQEGWLEYPDTWCSLFPGMVVEKTFFLQAYPVEQRGRGFETPLAEALKIHEPYALEGLPSYASILHQKLRFAKSRYRPLEKPGFEMYPEQVAGTHFVMGWAGQAAAPGYALLALADRFRDPELTVMAERALDTLSTSPVSASGFPVRFDAEAETWSGVDPVSQGQGLENFARAIEVARLRGLDSSRWETFLRAACAVHAERILRKDWRPRSTAEGFSVSPLLRGARLFDQPLFREAALKAVEHYGRRHLDLSEPYWGGTLDANCEDKEGAWAGFQAFLAAYDHTGEERYLRWAEHALNVLLTYVVVWDIDLPPGRLRDHGFRSRGWSVVSPQNQHLDVYAVVATPEIYRMGELLGRDELKRLAAVMYRSCGQLIDPMGSQGEQIQQTNFAQHGDLSDVYRLRGGYSEGWTVFWITAHFLTAAAGFEQLGVDLDRR